MQDVETGQRREPSAHTLANWRAAPAVQHWCDGLLQMTGLREDEVEQRREALLGFCLHHKFDPERMVEECKRGEDRAARRAFYLRIASATPANLIVQSFLVHNGVNVFGELICMPRTREQLLVEQGARWVAEK